MAITPSQWSHVLTIPESYTPSAATSGQTIIVTESVIAKLSASDQATFWANVQNGGGDVRICENSDGTNQLPIEVVSLDSAAQKCTIWTRKPTYDGTGDLYVFIGKAGETQPPVTDSFGRNAVWQDNAATYNLNDNSGTDSTGNNNLLVLGAPTTISGVFGDALRFNSGADLLEGSFSGLGVTQRTLKVWVRPDSVTDNRYLSTFNGGGRQNLTALLLGFQSGNFNVFDEGYPTGSAPATQMPASTLQWQRLVYTWNGSILKGYINGVEQISVSASLFNQAPDFLRISPTSGGGGNFYAGGLQLFEAMDYAQSDSFISTEYANQSDPATFFGAPTLSTTGGAAGVTADTAFTVNAPSVSATASASLPNPVANANVTVNKPTVSASVSATRPVAQGSWYLNFQTDGYIQFSPLVSDIGVDYSWDIEFRAANNTSEEFIVLGEDGDVENFLIIRNDNTIDYKVDSSQKAFQITDKSDESAIYRFEARGGSISLYENNILKGTQSFPNVKVGGTLDSGFSRIGNARGDITRRGALYYLKYTDNNNSNNNRFFNPSSSGGEGATLPDDDSGLDGSQVGAWPSDNSEWVAYQDSVSSDIAFSVNAPVVTGNASATLPGYSAEVSFTVSAPSVSVNTSATLPNPSANVSYTISAPTVNALAIATLPNPVSDVAFSVSVPSVLVSATATEPNFNSSVAFTVNAPAVSISASATLPQPESAVSFTVSPPNVIVVAIVGGIAIIVDEETNINQRVLSNNINAPILSNNING